MCADGMRCWISITRLSAVAFVAFLLVSCGASTRPSKSEPSFSDDSEHLENSQKRLSGDFVVTSIEDLYRQNARSQAQTVFSFDENGNFNKQDKSRLEEGSYLITTQDVVVIYIERVNGEPLPNARAESYSIVEQRDDAIT